VYGIPAVQSVSSISIKICNASIDCPCFAKPDFAEQGCRYISREYKTHNIEIYVTYYHTYYTMVDLRVSAENRRRSRKDTILFIMTKKSRFTAATHKHLFWELRILPEWRMYNVFFSSCPIHYMRLTISANDVGSGVPLKVKTSVPKLMSHVTKCGRVRFMLFESILRF